MAIRVKRPSESSGGAAVPEEFDETRSYRTQCTAIEERPSTQPNSKSKTYLSWHLTPYDDDGVAFIDPGNGGPLDVWATSPLEMWSNAKSGEIAKGREYANAFYGRELSDEEIDDIADEFDEAIVGKWAMGTFEVQTTASGFTKLGVLKLRPLRKTPAASRPMPQSAAVPPRDD
jgi:hypothetical protein